MRTIKLDLEKMSSLPALHKYLHQALELPEYYGANLDALYDCLAKLQNLQSSSFPVRLETLNILVGMENNCFAYSVTLLMKMKL